MFWFSGISSQKIFYLTQTSTSRLLTLDSPTWCRLVENISLKANTKQCPPLQFCHIVINPRMGSFFAHLADLPTMPPQRSFPANCTPGPRLIPCYIYFNVSVVFILFLFRLIFGPVVSSSTLFSAAPFPLTMSTSPHFSGLFALTQIEICRKQIKPISCKNRYVHRPWVA